MNKNKKSALIVDDEPSMLEILQDRFIDCKEVGDCPYEFEVETARSAAECVSKIRTRAAAPGETFYDVIVLDIRMEHEISGLNVAQALSSPEIARSLAEGFGFEKPIRIVITGYPNYNQCVQVIRSGAWDYIVKEDVDDKPMSQIVVDSAVARLRQLDSRQHQERQIAADWIPRHFIDIQNKYSGKLIALWHQPKVEIIASGADAFELEDNLKEWRSRRAAWEQPFVVRIPPGPNIGVE
jgi:CheY-like chemotaxis protein